MRLGTFVRKNRPSWQRLETMLQHLESRGIRKTTRPFLHELSSLYRATTVDLAYAQTHYQGTTLLLFLHQLVARAHNQIYRPHRITLSAIGYFFRNEVPNAVRLHFTAVIWASIIFIGGLVLGMAAVQFDEHSASVVLPATMIDDINSGQMWTVSIFSVVPAPLVSTQILTNNISVALFAFAGGLTLGMGTAWILFFNGFLLGVTLKLCSEHGLLLKLLEFIAGHGVIEISSFIVSGAAGLVLANALLNPGPLSRADALHIQGNTAWRMALACVPVLMVAATLEGFISPSQLPIWFKVALGLTLGGMFWSYLLWTGRPPKKIDQAK